MFSNARARWQAASRRPARNAFASEMTPCAERSRSSTLLAKTAGRSAQRGREGLFYWRKEAVMPGSLGNDASARAFSLLYRLK